MKTIAIIPARYGSTRYPGKPLVEIFGRPMIEWVYINCQKSSSISKVIVATDDIRIMNWASQYSANVMMTSSKHQSGTDRCYEVVKRLADDGEVYDLILNIQGDEPFTPVENIEALIHCVTISDARIGTLGLVYDDMSITDNPNRVKIKQQNGKLSFFRAPEDPMDRSSYGLKHIGMYAYTSNTLSEITALPMSLNEKRLKLEQWRWLDNGYNIALAKVKKESPSVDTPEDLDAIVAKGEAYWTVDK